MSDFTLEGKVALVTGGGRGIGAEIARTFAEAGASVMITSRTQAQLDEVAGEIRAAGGTAATYAFDINDLSVMPDVVDRTIGELGGVDVLVNNAGGGDNWAPFLQHTVEQLEAEFHKVVSVAFEMSRLCVPSMLERPGASIINTCSIATERNVRGHLAYDCSKGALVYATKSMAADLGPKIRVNGIAPNATETPALKAMFDSRPPEMKEMVTQGIRLRRMATTRDIANTALFLASPAGGFITGRVIPVDGGAVDEAKQQFPDL
jgi:7-alpha-hydroxysteroid dehydrogenase